MKREHSSFRPMKKLKLSKAYDEWGASMGRQSWFPDNRKVACKLRMQKLRLCGDYDEGGAYWGKSKYTSIFCAWSEADGICTRVFVRAASRREAKDLVKTLLPNARFFR